MDFLIPIFNTLVIAVAAILLMVGLMSAPWQVLLLILALGVWLSKWLIRRSQLQEALEDLEGLETSPVEPSQPVANVEMPLSSVAAAPIDAATLSYRGASYSPPQSQAASDNNDDNQDGVQQKDAASESLRSGKYRGGIWTT
jgi:UPF0716 family protein affecting phage T7 exclusion